ncbi:uncharacterized protein N7515_009091 [Penicillium bovifimosum]|uniref:DNA polymerase n=1 Tax=Penicillium bovifimosum TaxID=126998 RepID=A0A9W9KVP6_9EURO|nr:uncharacterized protein N7515_009091 [Penicillium bovifimosum]KAJ5121130.1 hypothetical protein N7515_009091 [Penicillium bovifimosum]
MILNKSSSPRTGTNHVSIFSSQPPIFILPTHLSLGELDETEGRLVDHGGKVTYDIAEAGLILGKIERPKRAALELRSRGIWTEETIPDPTPKSTASDMEPPVKRRRTGAHDGTKDIPIEIIDLDSETQIEKNKVASQLSSPRHLAQVQKAEQDKNSVTVLKLEWLLASIASGEMVCQDSYVVYRGRKIPPRPRQHRPHERNWSPNQVKSSSVQSKMPAHRHHPFLHQITSAHDAQKNLTVLDPPSIDIRPPSKRSRTHHPNQTGSATKSSTHACALHPCTPRTKTSSANWSKSDVSENSRSIKSAYGPTADIAAYPHRLRLPGEILTLPGCDVKIADLFAQFQQHGGCSHTDDDGNVAAADALETDPMLRVLNSFYQIWGIGAKTARDFYQRGWRDLDDIVEHGWNTLSRVQQIGLKYYEEFQEGIPRAESEKIANVIRDHPARVRNQGGMECIIVGGYRRGKGLSGDVDIVVTHRDDVVTYNLVVDLVASLEEEHYITHTLHTLPLHHDETRGFDTLDKALVVWQDPDFDAKAMDGDDKKKNPNIHRRVDIIISPWRTVGCAVLGWSGDTTFQRDLRRYAKKSRSWKFDSSGVRDRVTGNQVDLEHGGETWEEREKIVLDGLGAGWRPAEERCSG